MTSATKSLVYRIGADYGDLRRKMEETTSLTGAQRKEFFALQRQQREHRQTITDLGVGMTAFGAATLLGLGIATKAAIQWESAFAGVRKTVDGSDAEIASLEGELRQLARTLPTTHEEIAGVAEAAGQLGIKRKDIAEFTKTMIDLGNTTNLTAEEAATDLAKFSNIMGTSASDVDRLGSALVALGNDGASTEKDIISMGLRIAGAGKQLGLTESEVLGLASALSSVGVLAEGGGSSISTAMVKIASAVQNGGAELEAFAKVAGMSGEEFARVFRDDASTAIVGFIQGLGRMQSTGDDVFGTLDGLGLATNEVRDTLLRAAGASDTFAKALDTGSKAWIENAALTEEANKRYETSASKLQVAGNQIKDTLIDIGAALAPIAANAAQGASDIAKGFQELPGPLRDVVTWAGAAAGGIALLGGGAAIAAPKVMDFRDKMRGLEASGGMAGKGLGKLGLFMTGPWGAAIGIGVGLLGVLAGSLGATTRHEEELAAAGKSVADALREQNGVINESVRTAAAKAAADVKIERTGKNLLETARGLGIELTSVTDAILQQGDAWPQLRGRLEEQVRANTEVDTSTGTTIETLNDQGKAYQDLLVELDRMVNGKNAELQKQKDTAAATGESTKATKKQADEQGRLAKEAEKAADALDELVKALDAINGVTLTAREANRAYIEQLAETAEVLKKNGKGLDEHTVKGMENARALDAQAEKANALAEAAAREAASTGGAAAGAAALTASLEASRPALIKQAIAFGMSQKEAEAYAEKVLAIPDTAPVLLSTPGSPEALVQLAQVREAVNAVPPGKTVNVGVLDAVARKKLEELGFTVERLPDGTVNVTAITAGAQQQLNTFVAANQGLTIQARIAINSAAVAREVRYIQGLGNAYGNVVRFAGGGTYENHQPMVARAQPGTVRVWAEEETAGETYLPWAMDRRARALDIARYTLGEWGWDIVPRSQPPAMWAGGAGAGMAGSAASGYGGGVRIENQNLNVTAYSDRFSLSQVMNDIAMSGVR